MSSTGTLSAGTIARYAIGSVGTGGFSTLPGLVLTYYLTDSLGVTALIAGIVVTAPKVTDVLLDPIIGRLSDRDQFRRHSRRRSMAVGGLAIPVLFALTFAVPPGTPPALATLWVLVAFILAATAFSLFQVPYITLPAELTGRYHERTRLLSWRVVVLTAAILLFGAGGPALRRVTDETASGYLLMGVVCGAVIGAGMLVASTVARRTGTTTAVTQHAHTPLRAAIRGAYAAGIRALRSSAPFRSLLATFFAQALATGLMLAGAQYVATWVLDSEAAVELLFITLIAPALVAAPGWAWAARRYGKERAFALASILFLLATLALAGAIWEPGSWIYLPVGVCGIAYAGMQSLPLAMLPDVIAVDARRHGGGRAGTFGGVWTAGETIGFALGAATLAVVLEVTGYVSSTSAVTAVQPAAAVTGIMMSFSIIPSALIALSLMSLSRYRLRQADVDSATQSQDG